MLTKIDNLFIPRKDDIIVNLKMENEGRREAYLDLKEKFDKYKKAFEIFNRDKKITLHTGRCPISKAKEYAFSIENFNWISKEEYELLEELMKGEKN